MNIETMLNDEIRDELEELKKMELGTDKYKTAVDGLTKLIDKTIDLKKVEVERKERAEARDIETDLKLKQMEDDCKDRRVRNGLTAVSILGGLGVTVWGALKSWKFEETGVVTSTAGRKFISSLFFKK